ncbi:MAG: nucleotidyl transferase AbiEii/AbiGii toxin family protein [Planctomycetia bacterium]|nr:nucleotidyl transferase AbiEii/AbiGii toxin family protein [Planctomycetia bacterium]
MNLDDLHDPLRDFVSVFERLSIPYALIGGIAVGVHGIPRPTHDLDFTITVDRSRLPEFFDVVNDLGYDVPQEFVTGWVDQVAGLALVRARQWVQGKTIDIDLFLAECQFQDALMQRRIEANIEGISTWIASAEDIILLKLLASRPRDIGDVQDILLVQGQLDEQYLRHWADELGVRPQLEEALDEFK